MENGMFSKNTTNLNKDYDKAFSGDSHAEKFRFISKFLRKFEENQECLNNVFCMKNPIMEVDDGPPLITDMEKNCLSFLKNLAKQGKKVLFKDSPCAEAQAFLGMAYELGAFGMKKNWAKAYSYYTMASRQNNPLGTFRLAQCFEKGIGKTRSKNKALTFYRCAAKLGLIEALHTYGAILIYGDLGCKKDAAGGIFYLKMAAKNANSLYPYPYFDLARCFEADVAIQEIISDDTYAFCLYLKGAKLGCPNCQYRIARCYEFGELGKEKCLETAIGWYKKAADLGQIDAQLALSSFYFTGIDHVLDKDDHLAYTWALKAAVKGHIIAAFCVAEFVENGVGVKKDIIHALWWYSIANVLGHARASLKIDELKTQVSLKNQEQRKPAKCSLF